MICNSEVWDDRLFWGLAAFICGVSFSLLLIGLLAPGRLPNVWYPRWWRAPLKRARGALRPWPRLSWVPSGDANCGRWQRAERPRVQSGILGSHLHSAELCFSERSQRRTDESPSLILLPRLEVSRSKTRRGGAHGTLWMGGWEHAQRECANG